MRRRLGDNPNHQPRLKRVNIMNDAKDWAVKNVKSFVGNEGYGFNASVYYKGKRVALAYDDASGGPVVVQWSDKAAEQALQTHLKTLPEVPYDYGVVRGAYKVDEGMFVVRLVDRYEEDKQLKRHCKTKTLFRCKGDEDGSWRTVKIPFSKITVEHLSNKCPDIEEFANSRFGEPS